MYSLLHELANGSFNMRSHILTLVLLSILAFFFNSKSTIAELPIFAAQYKHVPSFYHIIEPIKMKLS